MIRKVDLTGYLPAFLLEYEELRAALEAANLDFRDVWQRGNMTLNNGFVSTADTNAIGRYEKIYGIQPDSLDALEQRRARVMGFLTAPYPMTLKYLNAWLKSLNAGNSAEVNDYSVLVLYHLEDAAMSADEMRAYLEKICPLNMNIVLSRIIEETAAARTAANITRLTKTLYVGMRE